MQPLPYIPIFSLNKNASLVKRFSQTLSCMFLCVLVVSFCACQGPCGNTCRNQSVCQTGNPSCRLSPTLPIWKCPTQRTMCCQAAAPKAVQTPSRFSPQPAPGVNPAGTVFEDPSILTVPPSTQDSKANSTESPVAVPTQVTPQAESQTVPETGTNAETNAETPTESQVKPEFELEKLSADEGAMMQPRSDVKGVRVLEVPEELLPENPESSIPETVEAPESEPVSEGGTLGLEINQNESDLSIGDVLATDSPAAEAAEELPAEKSPAEKSPAEEPGLKEDVLPDVLPLIPDDLEIPEDSRPNDAQAPLQRRQSPLKKALKATQTNDSASPKVIQGINSVSVSSPKETKPENHLKSISADTILLASVKQSTRHEETVKKTEIQQLGWQVMDGKESEIRLIAGEEPLETENVIAVKQSIVETPISTPSALENPSAMPARPSYAQPADEYIIDSKSAGKKRDLKEGRKTIVSGVEVENNWQAETRNETGTFIYYNGTQGRQTIQSPDPVYIYAPRFRAVRQIVDLNVDEQVMTTGDIFTPTHVSTANRNQETSTSKQNLQVGTDTKRTVMLQAQTNTGTGILDGEIAAQVKTQEAVIAQENRTIAGPNAMTGKNRAITADGLIEVKAWTKTDGLRVFIDKQSASAANRTEAAPSLYTVREGEHKQDVRIYKVTSKTSAKPGETVDFIIYFENTGHAPVGNITLVDNLPARLEIVEDSAESSVDSNFSYEVNSNGSQTLRWEVTQPLYAGEKGAVKFKALVR